MRTRFAPAPTGYLHLGHVVNAIYVWGLARAMDADVLLRIEDHDRQRSKPIFEQALLEDLDWLGFSPDRYSTAEFRRGRSEARQSDRGAIYESVARDLADRERLYACSCTRRQRTTSVDAGASTLAYAGTCRHRGLSLDGEVAWRVRLDDHGPGTWTDLLDPGVSALPGTWGDPVIRDRRGNWTYQFAVVVDDYLQGIDLVIRGRDLAASTALQLQLARCIGRTEPPRFAHHPLLMKSPTHKLSKSDGDTGIRALRTSGQLAADVIGQAAYSAGLTTTMRPIPANAVAGLFEGTKRSPGDTTS